MIKITLNTGELRVAAVAGVERHIQALRRGYTPKHGADPNTIWQIHCEGACGEAAVAKALGIPFNPTINTFRDVADVGIDIEVRTRSEHWHDLIIRPDDADDSLFVLVTGRAPTYKIRGGILGKEAKHDKYLKSHGGRPPAFFVPVCDLAEAELVL